MELSKNVLCGIAILLTLSLISCNDSNINAPHEENSLSNSTNIPTDRSYSEHISGTFSETLTLYPNNGPIAVNFHINFYFEFDNPNCTVENFEWGYISINPSATNITAIYDDNQNKFIIYFTYGNKFVHSPLTLNDLVTSAYDNGTIESGPWVCI